MSDLPDWLQKARDAWQWRGQERPAFAEVPGPGQQSVWDYPRPPILVPDPRRVLVKLGDTIVADTQTAQRLLETSHPPTFYLPLADINKGCLVPVPGGSFCEWKGSAIYYDIVAGGQTLRRTAWTYPEPIDPAFAKIAGCVAFYATQLECIVGGERVRPQAGGLYGGWITSELVGPFKGDPGTRGW